MAKNKPPRNLQPAGQITARLQAVNNQILASVKKQDWKRVEIYAKNMADVVESLARELDKKDFTPEEDPPPVPLEDEKDI